MLELKYQEGIPDFVWYQEPSTWCSLHNSGSYWKAFFFFCSEGGKKKPKKHGMAGYSCGSDALCYTLCSSWGEKPELCGHVEPTVKKIPSTCIQRYFKIILSTHNPIRRLPWRCHDKPRGGSITTTAWFILCDFGPFQMKGDQGWLQNGGPTWHCETGSKLAAHLWFGGCCLYTVCTHQAGCRIQVY